MAAEIRLFPCLSDNFGYLIHDPATKATASIDAPEAAPIIAALEREGWTLTDILITHHHHDHVGGVAELVAAHPGVEVVAHTHDCTRVPNVTRTVDEGARVALPGTQLVARIVHNPGHTLGAISYVLEDTVFTGDTLFAAGCGRLFEGDAAMMFASLAKLAALPPATRVFFGHEYTRKNLAFAVTVEPDNTAVTARLDHLREPSTPSTIGDELATNVFVRATSVAELAERRARKDAYRG